MEPTVLIAESASRLPVRPGKHTVHLHVHLLRRTASEFTSKGTQSPSLDLQQRAWVSLPVTERPGR